MKVIIGLGNPGEQFVGTRHNIGFEFLNKLQKEFNSANFEFNKKFNAEISKGSVDGIESLLVKPQTFMNLSGETVRLILDFYKLPADDIIVIQDDLDIALGKYKIATDSSSAGHNGIQNIIDQLGTQKFKRLRIGIGEEREGAPVCRLGAHPPRIDERSSSRVEAGDFVLGKFSEVEKEKIESISAEIINEIKKLL